MIVNRAKHHQNSSQIGSILAPEARAPLPRDYRKENYQLLKAKEQIIQKRIDTDINAEPQELFKMRRFQSVESKVGPMMG